MAARGMWQGCVLLILMAGLSRGDENVAAKPADPKQIASWVRQLDDDGFAVREMATIALGNAGVAALPALTAAARQGPPETRIRATHVLAALYQQADKSTVESVEDAIEALLAAGGTVGDQAEIVWEQQQRPREQRCLTQLERLGARVAYREDRFGMDREDLEAERKIPLHVAITAKWTGGDDGLKFIRRIQPRQVLVPFTVYRVNGNPVSDQAFVALEDAGVRVEKRGAMLGVTNNTGFDPAADDIPGFRIGQPKPGSAAEKGGLQVDDIIVAFGDKTIENFNDLVALLLETKPGDKAEFTVLREQMGKRATVRLTVELGDW
jgi:hypothetical protein